MTHHRNRILSAVSALFICLLSWALLIPTPAQSPATRPPPIASGGAVTVPFDLIGQHIFLHVRLNGTGPYWFAVDTGAYNLLMPNVAREVGAITDSGPRRRAEVASVQVAGLTLAREPFAVFPMPDYEAVEGVTPFGGLIGYELFRQYIVTIDYQRHVLILTPPAQFRYAGAGVARDLTFRGHIPQIRARLDGVDGTFNVDTGDRRSLAVFRDFRGKCHVPLGPPVVAMTGWGVRGPIWSRLGRADTFQIGNLAVTNPLIEFDLPKGGAFDFPHVAGNLGGCLLEQFTVTLDYSRRRAYFERNANFGRPITWDRSGLWLMRDGAAFRVRDVADGSPAAAAGLHSGDRITAVDGRAASQIGLPELRARLKTAAPGTRVRFTAVDGGATREATLTLRDLI